MAEWFPKISLLGFLGKPFTSGAGVTGGNEKLWAIGPLFGWPIIDFGRIYFNIKAKQSLQRQALLMYEKSVTNAVKEVESWLNAYVREKERANALYQKLSHAQRVLQLSQDLFAAGLEAEMVVLNNQKRVNSVRLELVDSQEKVAANFIALYKAFGGDW
jgi:outer membrane protein TolC